VRGQDGVVLARGIDERAQIAEHEHVRVEQDRGRVADQVAKQHRQAG
jgi:hypothetical protein